VSSRKRRSIRVPRDDRLHMQIVRTLEEGLSRLGGRRIRVLDLERRYWQMSSTFRTERLRVVLGGTEKPLRVFFKDFNPRHQVTDVRARRRLSRVPPRRELEMYRSILSRERFGTLDLYAFRWDAGRGRFWMFLEDAGRTRLKDVPEFREWEDAARWAARFHAATRDLPPALTRFLPRWGRAHYRRCAARVAQLLPTVDTADRDVLRRGLDALTARLDWFSALPRCVVHGQFFGENIMLRARRSGPRIAVIDWETAALGPRALDIVSLSTGSWTDAERSALRRAYFDQCRAETGEVLNWDEFCQELRMVALYHTLEWLVWWAPYRNVPEHLARFQRSMGRLAGLL
jgi:Phosphotransferase enzyme family